MFGAGRGRTLFMAATALAAVACLVLPPRVVAQSVGQCELAVGDAFLSQAVDAGHAIQLDAGSTVDVVAISTVPGRVTLAISLGPLSWQVVDGTLEPGDQDVWRWSGMVDVSAYASVGVGLYELRANAGACELSGVVDVTGKPAYAAPLGWAALAVFFAGILLAGRALLAIRRRKGGLVLAAAGGGAIGLGLLLLAQQSGVSEATPWAALTWLVLPALVGVAIHTVARVVAGGMAVQRPPSGAGAGTPESSATPPVSDDPPRTSYARVDCPEAVVTGMEFELTVGLGQSPDPLVVGEPLRRPPSSIGPYVVTIQVIADGFSLRPDERWRVDMPVTVREPYPSATLHLIAAVRERAIAPASIRAMYSVEGHPIGLAVRPLAVVRAAELLDQAPPRSASPAVDMNVPVGLVPPDLTVRIERAESQASGRLLMQLLAADPDVRVPSAPMAIDIGGDPAHDLRRIVDEMNAAEGKPTQFVSLRGIGLSISEQLPDAFWEVLRDIAGRLEGRPPMILFLSAEPYVPWELAVVEPALDPSAPPFLSAQANVGRWALGQRRPKLPPPSTLSVRSFAVVSGVYDLPGWERLVDAEGEAGDIVDAYGATAVNATVQGVLGLLRGTPAADLIHFAVHGTFDRDHDREGLIMVDGNSLDPLAVRGTSLSGTPFVFLNACQVGRGDQLLGDHAGLADAFLFAGAAGVVAPLWSIDDRLARQIALRFYARALNGEAPSDILRTERAAFRESPETISSTYLAYQYFGHPALRLERADGSPEGSPPGPVASPGPA